jgi:predicted DNA-binding protein
MKKESRYSIRLPSDDAEMIESIAKRESVEKSMVVRFAITSTMKLIKVKDIPESLISPELAFLRKSISSK